MAIEHSSLSPDIPLKHPSEDALGYAPFAKQLADVVMRMIPHDGLVMSINGSWGAGKSTVLNFMIHYLEQEQEEKRPLIIRFNPWWFSGQEDLTRLLIGQIRARLGDKDYGSLKKKLADFADLASKIPVLPGREVGEFFAKKLNGEPDLIALKEKIDELLLSKNRKILVLIDDIDRLSSNEVRDLFRTIKATANFSNVIYLLAFDNKVVVEALEQGYVISGQQYLEKIVQVPFDLPHLEQTALRKLFFEELQKIISGTPEYLFDEMHWANIYFDGLEHFINTPRTISRLINTLRATYLSVKGEVNSVDFIVVEALRLFRPEIYNVIRKNKGLLTGILSERALETDNIESYKKLYQSWLSQSPEGDREAVKLLLARLFPNLESLYMNALYSSDFLSIWRKQLRICSPDIFPIYFRFSVAEDAITAAELQLLLNFSNDAVKFGNILADYSTQIGRDGTTRLRSVLERLQDYTREDISTENIETVVCALFRVGDQLLKKEDERRYIFDVDNDMRISRLVYQLISRLEEEKRFEILFKAIQEGEALSLSVHEVSILGQHHGKFTDNEPKPESQRIVNSEHLSLLEQLVLEKIHQAAENNVLLATPKLARILWSWKTWVDDEQEVRNWVFEVTEDNKDLAIFLEHFANIHYISSSGDTLSRSELRVELKHLEPFIDLSNLIDRVRGIIDTEALSEDQLIVARQFIKEYDLMSQGNKLAEESDC